MAEIGRQHRINALIMRGMSAPEATAQADREYPYQVTCDGTVIADFPNGYDAGEFAHKFFTTRAASGKVVTIQRSDGKPVA